MRHQCLFRSCGTAGGPTTGTDAAGSQLVSVSVWLAPQSSSPAPPCWLHTTMSICLHPQPRKRCPPWVSSTFFTTSEACFNPFPVGQSWHFLDHADIHTLFRAIWPPRSALRLHFHSLRRHLFVISPSSVNAARREVDFSLVAALVQ